MSSYTYTAKRSPTEYISGEIEADSVDIVRARLREEGLFPLAVTEGEEGPQDGWSFLHWRRSAGSQDLAMFARQLGNMLSAGLPVLQSLETYRTTHMSRPETARPPAARPATRSPHN